MMLYALGALSEYSILYAVEKVIMTIVQPRLDSISEYEMSVEELLTWGESVKLMAQIAFAGGGVYSPGDYCQFCRAKALCRARSEFNITLEDFKLMKPPLISNEEVGQILERAQNLSAWVKNLEDYALAECLKGNEIPGWKAVHGRGNRKFSDIDAAFKVLTTSGTEEAMLYTKEPLSLSKVEELIGKAKFKELLTEYINVPPGKPALVTLSDKREPITRRTAEDDFKIEGGNENE
jgi:hypothetical protein